MRRNSRGGLGAVFGLFVATASTAYACIPEPDTSGLPGRDASVADTSFVPPKSDTGVDAVVEAGSDAPVEASTGPGSIHGAVLNYGEGMGRGVLPGATVSVVGASPAISVVTGDRGEFVLNNVPSGRVVLDVSHPTDKTRGIAYGTTQVTVNLAGGQDASVFPFVHTGCFVHFDVLADTTSGMIRRLQDGCPTHTGAYASIYIPDIAALQRASGEVYAGGARVELIPVAFPLSTTTDETDFSWSIGAPDLNADTGKLDLVGAAEIRVVADGTVNGVLEGTPLQPVSGHAVAVEVPVEHLPAAGEQITPFYFDRVGSQTWKPDNTATNVTFGNPDAAVQNTATVSMHVTHFGWFGIGQVRSAKTCVVGRLAAGTVHPANVLVHAVGADYFGANSAMTSDDGTFCIDVKASSKVQIVAKYGATGGAFGAITQATASGNAGPSCASNSSACTQLGDVPMAAIDGSCVLATIMNGDAPITVPLDVYSAELQNIGPAEHAAGIANRAYINRVTPSAAGAVCVPSTPNDSLELQDHANGLCDGGGAALIQVPPGIPSATCGGAGCVDAGASNYSCP